MNKTYPFEQLRPLIEQSQSVSVFLSSSPQFDQVAAALAFKLALEKKGKSVSVLSGSPMTVGFGQLVGVDTIGQKNEFGQNLVISLDYPLEQIEKVSYNDNGGKLNLVVQPKTGASRPEKDQVVFSYEGANKDLQMTIGVESLANLGSLSAQIEPANLVSLNLTGSNFAKLNILDPEACGCSEMMVAILFNLGFMVDEDIANNLFLGLNEATRNFAAENLGPDAFEAAAICLRWGAKKAIGYGLKKPSVSPSKPIKMEKPAKFNQPPAPSSGPSPDWFEPKIFKSSNL